MGIAYNPKIVKDGLVLHLDAANKKSYQAGSIYFDGNGDKISLNPGSTFQFGIGNFTVETWVNFSVLQSCFFVDARNGAQTNTWAFFFDNDTKLLYWYDGSTQTGRSWNPSINTWYHITYCKNGSSGQLYVNGVALGASIPDTMNYTVAPTLSYIGGRYILDQYSVNGFLSDLRITKGVARYTGNFTPIQFIDHSTDIYKSNVSLLLKATYGIKDYSDNTFLLTFIGNVAYSGQTNITTWTDISGKGNNGTLVNGPTFDNINLGCFNFDSANDYCLVAQNNSIPYGSASRTISIWFYSNNTTWINNDNNLFFYGAGSTAAAFGIDFSVYPFMEVFTWGGTGRDLSFATTYTQVGWKNITVSYDGNTTIKIYENGKQTQTFNLSSACNTTISDVYVGAINPAALANGFFDGKISLVHIYNRALTTEEVLQNFNALRGRYGI